MTELNKPADDLWYTNLFDNSKSNNNNDENDLWFMNYLFGDGNTSPVSKSKPPLPAKAKSTTKSVPTKHYSAIIKKRAPKKPLTAQEKAEINYFVKHMFDGPSRSRSASWKAKWTGTTYHPSAIIHDHGPKKQLSSQEKAEINAFTKNLFDGQTSRSRAASTKSVQSTRSRAASTKSVQSTRSRSASNKNLQPSNFFARERNLRHVDSLFVHSPESREWQLAVQEIQNNWTIADQLTNHLITLFFSAADSAQWQAAKNGITSIWAPKVKTSLHPSASILRKKVNKRPLTPKEKAEINYFVKHLFDGPARARSAHWGAKWVGTTYHPSAIIKQRVHHKNQLSPKEKSEINSFVKNLFDDASSQSKFFGNQRYRKHLNTMYLYSPESLEWQLARRAIYTNWADADKLRAGINALYEYPVQHIKWQAAVNDIKQVWNGPKKGYILIHESAIIRNRAPKKAISSQERAEINAFVANLFDNRARSASNKRRA
ncbi:hypothetical protein BCR33DRAFT_712586 [Rhizoclosmatium globosum]|uniref:Uncharacterized protein n=1 Tax=Rhizoclosmatium globosum TaxID=329046 RepID=A0A1Y2CXI9_9FUNG|nr:hypothetical protein BCR33DRAFT_712586 [Rhizoclosmatium globosum]|eukprot:ORY51554.1 hypothetical protein BCR33DRAFT_712586 [Rhizoclosmatium globosum]